MQSIHIVRVLLAASTLTISSFSLAQISTADSAFASDIPAGGPGRAQKAPHVRHQRDRQVGRSLHRLLPVLLRQLGQAQSRPADQVRWGRFNELAERNNWLLYRNWNRLQRRAAKRSPLEAKYGDFYASCMDTTW